MGQSLPQKPIGRTEKGDAGNARWIERRACASLSMPVVPQGRAVVRPIERAAQWAHLEWKARGFRLFSISLDYKYTHFSALGPPSVGVIVEHINGLEGLRKRTQDARSALPCVSKGYWKSRNYRLNEIND
jgi:hypothetical protein